MSLTAEAWKDRGFAIFWIETKPTPEGLQHFEFCKTLNLFACGLCNLKALNIASTECVSEEETVEW